MKPTRRLAREVAMQVLFQYELHPDATPESIRTFMKERLDYPKLEEYSLSLVEGVRQNLPQIDHLLDVASTNWSLGRLAAVDRSILRLATYELKFTTDTPAGVAINEALEICKKFSAPEALAFVNGVLDRIGGRRAQPAEPAEQPTPPQEESTAAKDEGLDPSSAD